MNQLFFHIMWTALWAIYLRKQCRHYILWEELCPSIHMNIAFVVPATQILLQTMFPFKATVYPDGCGRE